MRRRDVIAGAAAASAAVAVGLYRFTGLFAKHYAPTPYDDVLARLVDREQAARLGAKVTGPLNLNTVAARLRLRLKANGLTAAAADDIASGRLQEVDGWVLPQSVALLSALASRV